MVSPTWMLYFSFQVYTFVLIVTVRAIPGLVWCYLLYIWGDILEINYKARIKISNCPIFDSSLQQWTRQPNKFLLGWDDMIAGIDQGFYDMCTGEQRKWDIPPALQYGIQGNQLFWIPNRSRLIWKIELISINSVQGEDKTTSDGLEGRSEYWILFNLLQWCLSKCYQFECQVGRVEWCSNIHLECFYTTELGEYAGKYIYKQASHVCNMSYCEILKVEEYSVEWMSKFGK